MFDPEEIKKDFPILARQIHDHSLVYLDSAATAQKPQVVIDAIVDYYTHHNANIHRGVHTLGDESTSLYSKSRETIAKFLGAQPNELVFVRNTTEAINLVGYSWAMHNLSENDYIITSELEHHSNLLIWQQVARESGAKLTFVDVTQDGQIDLDHLQALLETFGSQTKLVALSLLSNTTGAVLDSDRVSHLIKECASQAKLLLDAAQAAPQMPVNFKNLGADFLAFSGHKLYGPMGIGGLIVKSEILESMQPMFLGGGMIDEVYLYGATFAALPDRFDAGTPDVAGAVGLASAVEYLRKIGMEQVEEHSQELASYALSHLSGLGNLKLIGPTDPHHRLGSVAFVLEGIHAHDIAQILDSRGIAVRSGHHCTMPLHQKLNISGSIRASFGVYNSNSDIDALIEGLATAQKILRNS